MALGIDETAIHGPEVGILGLVLNLGLEKALREQGTSVEVYLYEEADHGFLAYTRPYYRPDAAQSAWKRTVEFLDSQLKK